MKNARSRRLRSGLDRAVLAIWRAQHASLPVHLSSEQLTRLLERAAAPCPVEHLDRAILLLLARLGLRGGEIMTLGLEDLDWRAGQLRMRTGKCRRDRGLPLPQEVGMRWRSISGKIPRDQTRPA